MEETKGKPIYASLMEIQTKIVAPKDQDGHKNQYKYRTVESILTAVKPLLKENSLALYLTDDVEKIGERYYVVAYAKLIDIVSGEILEGKGKAREPETLATMAPPQITGASSTYARKRALEGLFLLDNEKDIDSKEVQEAIEKAREQAPAQDKVRAQAINRLNAVISKYNLNKGYLSNFAYGKIGKRSTEEMSDKEILMLAESLEAYHGK